MVEMEKIKKIEKTEQGQAIRQQLPDARSSGGGQSGRPAMRDSVSLGGDWGQTNWKQAVSAALEALQKSFPNIKLVTGSAQDEDALREIALRLGDGKHLVIDPRLIERMGEGPEAFKDGYETLLRLLRRMQTSEVSGVYVGEDKAVGWKWNKPNAAFSELQQAQDTLRRFTELNSNKEKERPPWEMAPPRSYSTKDKYTRLARATDIGQIHALVANVYSTINSLQSDAMSGSGETGKKARRAIRSLRMLLTRASRKISRLQAEQLVSAKKKRAEREQKQKEVIELRQEQRQLRTKRMRADQRTAAGGIHQTPPPQKHYGYRDFQNTDAAITSPLPTVEGMPPVEGAAEGTVVIGPEITL